MAEVGTILLVIIAILVAVPIIIAILELIAIIIEKNCNILQL